MTPTASPPPAPMPGLMTAAEFMDRYENVHAELIRGVVKEYPMPGLEHGKICARIAALVYIYLETNDIGHVMSNDTSVQTESDPDTLRGGDVCFWSYERLPSGSVPKGLGPAAPDLVFEVRSPSDLWTEIFAKVEEYIAAGVRAVVLIDPNTETASVCRPEQKQHTFYGGDSLTLPDVLPGFAVEVARLFKHPPDSAALHPGLQLDHPSGVRACGPDLRLDGCDCPRVSECLRNPGGVIQL